MIDLLAETQESRDDSIVLMISGHDTSPVVLHRAVGGFPELILPSVVDFALYQKPAVVHVIDGGQDYLRNWQK